jgi:hypothetical protein
MRHLSSAIGMLAGARSVGVKRAELLLFYLIASKLDWCLGGFQLQCSGQPSGSNEHISM